MLVSVFLQCSKNLTLAQGTLCQWVLCLNINSHSGSSIMIEELETGKLHTSPWVHAVGLVEGTYCYKYAIVLCPHCLMLYISSACEKSRALHTLICLLPTWWLLWLLLLHCARGSLLYYNNFPYKLFWSNQALSVFEIISFIKSYSFYWMLYLPDRNLYEKKLRRIFVWCFVSFTYFFFVCVCVSLYFFQQFMPCKSYKR